MIWKTLLIGPVLVLSMTSSAQEIQRTTLPVPNADHRVTSIYFSQDFINKQFQAHFKSETLQDLKVELDPTLEKILFRGVYQISKAETKVFNLDPTLRSFRFQVTVQPEATRKGYLVLHFPLNESFFYSIDSKNPQRDRVVIPVQLLSLALAYARGYLAALSGDFALFDRQREEINAALRMTNKSIASEPDPTKREILENERDSLRLKLAAIPIERKRFQYLAKDLGSILGFLGEKELNLNKELAAHHKSLIVKLNLAELTPYLTGMELGGIRILHDDHDGPHGENYFSVDINADIPGKVLPPVHGPIKRPGLKIPPSVVIRINQALFESQAVLDTENKVIGSKIKNLKFELKNEDLQASGKYRWFLFSIPFSTSIAVKYLAEDQFTIAVSAIKIAGINAELLAGYILEIVKGRLDAALKGILQFDDLGKQKDQSRTLLVTVNPKKLIPALSSFHVIDVRLREKEFLLKADQSELPSTILHKE